MIGELCIAVEIEQIDVELLDVAVLAMDEANLEHLTDNIRLKSNDDHRRAHGIVHAFLR